MYPSVPRPSIKDIVARYGPLEPVEGPSMRDVAELLAPYTPLSEKRFYRSMKWGSALWRTLGVKTRKQFEKSYPAPAIYASVVLAFFLALRDVGLEIVALSDTPTGSMLEAKLPIDIWSLGGSLTLEIIDAHPTEIVVRGVSEVKGQVYDWGKGLRTLQEVFLAAQHYIEIMI